MVVVAGDDAHDGTVLADGVDTGLARAAVHVDHALVAELAGGPCDTAAMVSISRCRERDVAGLRFGFLAGQVVERHLLVADAKFLLDQPEQGEGTAEHLEAVQRQALAFVLHVDAA